MPPAKKSLLLQQREGNSYHLRIWNYKPVPVHEHCFSIHSNQTFFFRYWNTHEAFFQMKAGKAGSIFFTALAFPSFRSRIVIDVVVMSSYIHFVFLHFMFSLMDRRHETEQVNTKIFLYFLWWKWRRLCYPYCYLDF